MPNCPKCMNPLKPVREQYNEIRHGDWYCDTCRGDRGATGHRYYWEREVNQTELAEADMKAADESRLRWATEIAERIQVDMQADPDYGVAQAAEVISKAIMDVQYGGLLQAIEARGEIVDLTKKGEALCQQNGELLIERDRLRAALEQILPALEEEPVYHTEGMGCGLEDRSIHDRYDAMAYGWDAAVERFQEILDGLPAVVREALGKEATDASRD